MFGFLNVYKPKGKTSHDIVAILRRITKIKQIGHTGTLDPFAEGVLPICIGKATRLIEYLKDDKAYIGTVQLGSSTTTYDTEGDIVKTSSETVSVDDIESALSDFRGEIEQIPPIYSAIKVNGKKLYEYARKGEEVKIEPRKVTINELRILNYNKETRQLELFIDCSKGTYIRSIANDLGKKLEICGHLIKLVRIKAGDFRLENAVKLDNLSTLEQIEKNLLYPLNSLNEYPKYELNPNELEKISHGMNIKPKNFDKQGIVLLTHNNKLIAVANSNESGIKCAKVFI